jgi:hypothetical protein
VLRMGDLRSLGARCIVNQVALCVLALCSAFQPEVYSDGAYDGRIGFGGQSAFGGWIKHLVQCFYLLRHHGTYRPNFWLCSEQWSHKCCDELEHCALLQ